MVLLPEEAEMTLAELRQMAARQQHQIEAQQQLLVAKEQRLKFLKQQEARHHNLTEQQLDTACLQNLREKVETQELKLRQLRALRGQVEQQKTNNGNLGTELDSIRALFSEKEKELNLAVNKVEELTRQLDEIRNNNNRKNCIMSSAASELESLKRELLYRTKLAEQQNNYICQQRENIALRQQDIAVLDKKINELTQRLHRKRLLNEQLAAQIHNASLSRNSSNTIINNGLFHPTTIVTVEPIQRESLEPEHTQDDMAAKLIGLHKDDLGEFCLTKNDPKYQTLPYNTKFTLKGKHSEDSLSSSTEDESWSSNADYSSNNKSNSTSSVIKPSSNMCNFSPRPFNSTYNPNTAVQKITQHLQNRNHMQMSVENEIIVSNNLDESSEKKCGDWTDSTNNNNNSPISQVSDSELSNNSALQKNKEQPKHINSGIIKPVVPPKPALPVKPMLSQRQTHSTTKDKNLDERELVNVALSVLQNKSSDQEKNAFSNYRERLLYYQCVPRYSKEACPDQSSPKSKIVTYFPKPSEQSSQQDTKSNESFDHSESPKRKTAFGQLPIKPKPLTIRKTPGLEPPKLKVQPVVNTNLNRKINESHLLSVHLKTSISPSFISNSIEDSFVEDKLKPEDVKDLDEPPTSVEIPPLKSSSEDISLKTAEKEEVIDIWQPMQPVIEKEVSPEKYELGEICKLESTIGSEKQETDDVTTADETDDAISHSAALRRIKKGNLKSEGSVRHCRRVSFDPLALLLDAALEGELELVKKTASEVPNPSAANDEGITALHNAICAGHFDVVTFLVEFGCDVNAQDSDGWTPLHCAASCNNLPMVKFLVERGACIFATTLSDHETAAEKCEEEDEGFDGCSEYLYSLQENLGVMNNGIVYAVYDYEVQNADELSFKDGDMLTVLRKGDDEESEWWWSRLLDEEGYVPRNLLGLYPRVTSRKA